MNSPLILHAAPAAGFNQPFEMMSACHERVERMLGLLQRLQAHLGDAGADRTASDAARDVMRYFDQAAPQHHEDEERHVLPVLRASGEATLVALAERLHAQHLAMSAAWAELRGGLAALATGQWSASDADACFAQWRAFDGLYAGHLAAEDGVAYPEVACRLAPAAIAAMGDEMARRRGVR